MRLRPFWLLLSTVLLCLSGFGSSARAAVLFASSVFTNEVYRYQVSEFGSPTLDLTLTANLDRPGYVALSPWGELFVSNRGNASGGSGSVARFLNPTGAPVANGTIADNNSVPGFNFNLSHGLEFRGAELFVVNLNSSDAVLRFTFDAAGQASSNGIISDHLGGLNAIGIGFNAAGELFVSQANLSSLQLNQWRFDASGNSIFLREFSMPGSNNQGIAFAPWGEMFVAASNSNAVARVLFDSSGNPISNGLITGNGISNPADLTFSAWGELFVGRQGGISRFTFDASHNAIANGAFSTPQAIGGLVFAADANAVPEPSTLVLFGVGTLGLAGWTRRQQRRALS